ncbi:MAG: TRAP transporter large permease subunit, partial [Spirochaetia bacterium]|nr:TRAP transporter large permease subunit [Spirochaetia bacterium]
VIGYSPFGAATASIAVTFLLSFLRKDTMLTPKRLFDVFSLSGHNLIMLAVSCAGAGVVISVVTYTGLALGIATVITSFSGGFLLPALILIMITSMVLGMGLPCTPAYIIAITIGGPALLALGIDKLPAHLFVFYFAILAEVTPPVCIAAYCGAAIAGSKPMATGFEASQLAIMGYLIPFIFVYNQALIMNGPFGLIAATFLIMVVVSILSASSLSGFMFRKMNKFQSLLLGIAGITLTVLAASRSVLEQPVIQTSVIVIALALIGAFVIGNRKVLKTMAVSAA